MLPFFLKENYLKRTTRSAGYSLSVTYLTMEVILDELQKNNVDMNMKTLSYYINDLLQQHKTLYEEFTERVKFDEISAVFAETGVNNFGRAMAFLTLVYMMKAPEDVTREAVRLVATPLKNFDLIYYNKN